MKDGNGINLHSVYPANNPYIYTHCYLKLPNVYVGIVGWIYRTKIDLISILHSSFLPLFPYFLSIGHPYILFFFICFFPYYNILDLAPHNSLDFVASVIRYLSLTLAVQMIMKFVHSGLSVCSQTVINLSSLCSHLYMCKGMHNMRITNKMYLCIVTFSTLVQI